MLDLAKTALKKHSVTIAGHRTSISIEAGFWTHLQKAAERRELSINELIRQIDEARTGSLSGAIRVFVLQEIENQLS